MIRKRLLFANRQTFQGTSTLLNLFIYFIGWQILGGKCLKCLTIQYWPSVRDMLNDNYILYVGQLCLSVLHYQ